MHRLIELFEKWMAEEKRAIIDSITNGEPGDYPAYRELVGRKIEHSRIEQEFRDFVKQARASEDE